ncbi:thioredoxin family protein [Paenibacillus eucommiae]|uniref:Thioredoxin-like negative regulator of GroEL n=1 Tax=Paenibacillus eucommiae TaxID=1355755 RepID=A0ABS4J5Y2_9BACL|nr:thioredoxin family protein [Paenibacillus eucommiae]MBP1995257.1 thioredoxin-like negative regulator of GroEL [Paenibacillus eucommiae]
MQEWSQAELLLQAEAAASPFAVFLYTPFCGTCKLTERMLTIITTMEPQLPIYKSNINFLPQISRDWQITSVPCIVIVGENQNMEFVYRMKAVDDLYKLLRTRLLSC